MSLVADYGKKLQKLQSTNIVQDQTSSSTPKTEAKISFAGLTIENEKYTNDNGNMSLFIRLKKSDPYEWFIGYRNLKTELFKSYIVVPLELYFYMAFMVAVIYSFGCGILAYKDDPVQGFENLIESMQNNWKGALIILAIFMHRIVLKKIEDLKRFKDTEFK